MITTTRVVVAEPFCVLEFEPVIVFRVLSGKAWNQSQPSREVRRMALGDPGALRVARVEYDPECVLLAFDVDCIGATVLRIDDQTIRRMAIGSAHMVSWLDELKKQRRYGEKPVGLRRWLRTFLAKPDAERAEQMFAAVLDDAIDQIMTEQPCVPSEAWLNSFGEQAVPQ